MKPGDPVTLTAAHPSAGDRRRVYPADSVFSYAGPLDRLSRVVGQAVRGAGEPAEPLAVVHTRGADRSRLVFPLRVLEVVQ